MVLEDRSNIFREAIKISKKYSLLSSDAYIASFAKVYVYIYQITKRNI